jgi:squalene-associated FAD-dependent desaturase
MPPAQPPSSEASENKDPRVPHPSPSGGGAGFEVDGSNETRLPRSSRFSKGGNDAPTVAVIGGGLAGLAAGCALSASGFRVTLFERRPYLGGRASSYEHPGTAEVVDNCQHVLFGCCTNLIAFYKTIGIEEKIRWFDRMTFVEPGGRQSVMQPSSLPAPLHVTPSFLGLKFLSLRDKIALTRALVVLMTRVPKDDGTSFQDWLIRHHQTPASIERFWKPILVSALSEDLDRISVPYAAQVVRETAKSRIARSMGIPTVPLTNLYSAAKDYIINRGGDVRLRATVQSFQPTENGVRLKLRDSEEEFDYAMLAVPFDSLAKLLPDSPESQDLREKLSHFETSPITGVHFWFDRQITDLPHAVLLDRTIQWMFHKSMLLTRNPQPASPAGTTEQKIRPVGPAELSPAPGSLNRPAAALLAQAPQARSDFLSPVGATELSPALQRWETGTSDSSPGGTTDSSQEPSSASLTGNSAPQGRNSLAQDRSPGYTANTTESRRDASNDAGSYVELVISSSKSLINKSRQEIIDLALKELREFFPAAREANLLKATVIKELNATFSPTPGIDRYRPIAQSTWPRVFLAGDWTATGWPATMEGAVRSGYLAAETITQIRGNANKFLVPDLPPKGLMRFR